MKVFKNKHVYIECYLELTIGVLFFVVLENHNMAY